MRPPDHGVCSVTHGVGDVLRNLGASNVVERRAVRKQFFVQHADARPGVVDVGAHVGVAHAIVQEQRQFVRQEKLVEVGVVQQFRDELHERVDPDVVRQHGRQRQQLVRPHERASEKEKRKKKKKEKKEKTENGGKEEKMDQCNR